MPDVDDASEDPRWRKFVDVGLKCSCGEHHVGLISLSMLKPVGWPGPDEPEPDDALRIDGNFLSKNFCVRDGKYFAIRMSLPLAIHGVPPPSMLLSVWGSVDRTNFDAYVAAVRNNTLNDKAHMPARLVNRIAGFPDTFGLLGAAIQQPNEPPLLLVLNGADGQPNNNPIIHEERNGIPLDRLFDIYAENGHDMRSSFT